MGKGTRPLILLVPLLIVISVVVANRVTRMRREPDLESRLLPPPRLPRPNAFEDYREAGRLLVMREEIQGPRRSPSGAGPRDPALLPVPRPEVVEANAEALRRLRQGFAHRYQQPPPPPRLDAPLPFFADFRTLSQLVVQEGNLRRDRGDRMGALSCYLDALRLGEDLPRGGGLIGRLVGTACSAYGVRALSALTGSLSAGEARAGARRLEALLARHAPFSGTMLDEKRWIQGVVVKDFGRVVREVVDFAAGQGAKPSPFGDIYRHIALRTTSQADAFDEVTAYLNRCTEATLRPFALRPRPFPKPEGTLGSWFLPSVEPSWFRERTHHARSVFALLALALRAYRLEHGTYPRSLTDLTPGYLSALPADPFAASGPPVYRRSGAGYVLYSVGPDGRDDGGRQVRGYARRDRFSGPAAVSLSPDSSGDFVYEADRP